MCTKARGYDHVGVHMPVHDVHLDRRRPTQDIGSRPVWDEVERSIIVEPTGTEVLVTIVETHRQYGYRRYTPTEIVCSL